MMTARQENDMMSSTFHNTDNDDAVSGRQMLEELAITDSGAQDPSTHPPSLLESLPAELRDLILSHIPDLHPFELSYAPHRLCTLSTAGTATRSSGPVWLVNSMGASSTPMPV